MATPSSPPSQHHSHSLRLRAKSQAKAKSRAKLQQTTHSPITGRRSTSPSTMCKVAITMPSLVCLRCALRRWRSRAAVSSSCSSSGKGGADADAAVPAGHVAVSVEGRRFVVRVAHLGHPAFLELLRQAEEEYGFPAAAGPIALPCDEDHFLDVLHRVSSSSSPSSCCCGPALKRRGRGDARPLLQGMAVEKLVW